MSGDANKKNNKIAETEIVSKSTSESKIGIIGLIMVLLIGIGIWYHIADIKVANTVKRIPVEVVPKISPRLDTVPIVIYPTVIPVQLSDKKKSTKK